MAATVKAKIEEISLFNIVLKAGTKARDKLSQAYITELADDLRAGCELPPARVFLDKSGDYILSRGFHRWHAYKQAERETMPCEVFVGTVKDALVDAVGDNWTHGLRRTNEDKREAVTLMLKAFGKKKSARWIAKACGVSPPFVTDLQKQVLTVNTSKREGLDGKQYSATQPEREPEVVSTWEPPTAEVDISDSFRDAAEIETETPITLPPKDEPNTIGKFRVRIESFRHDLQDQPDFVRTLVADSLAELVAELRK